MARAERNDKQRRRKSRWTLAVLCGVARERERRELVSKAVRREITAAGATEGTERQQERQQLNVGIMPSFPASFASNPTFPYSPSHFLPGASIVLSLCVCSLVFLAWFGGSRARERETQTVGFNGGGRGEREGLSEKKGSRERGVRDVSGGSMFADRWQECMDTSARGGERAEGREPEGGKRQRVLEGGGRERGRGFGSRNGFSGVRTVLVLG